MFFVVLENILGRFQDDLTEYGFNILAIVCVKNVGPFPALRQMFVVGAFF